MKLTEHPAKTRLMLKTGLFATLRAFFRIQGSGAPAAGCTGASSYRHVRATPTVLAAMLGVLVASALGAAPALAATGHGFSASFGSQGSGNGEFQGPSGVAVNEVTLGDIGDVYVVDKGNNRVERFSATGEYKGQFDASGSYEDLEEAVPVKTGAAAPSGKFSEPEAIAIDNSTSPLDPSAGDVYVTDLGHKVIDKFSASGAYLGQITKGSGGAPLEKLNGVAVDPSGVLWVYQELPVEEIAGQPHILREIEAFTDGEPNVFSSNRESKTGRYQEDPGFAVDSEDRFYVTWYEGRDVAELNSAGEEIFGEEELGGEFKSGIAVDLATNDVYLDNNGTSVSQFAANSGPLLQTFGSGHLTGGAGLAVNSSDGTIYVADAAGNKVVVFDQGSTPEAPVTEPAGAITGTTAVLHGKLKLATGETKLKYYFEYNLGASCTGGSKTAAKEGEGAVSEEVTGLEPSKEYTFCIVTGNEFGSTQGNEVPFTTKAAPPVILGESAPDRSTQATLHARINPDNQETKYSFEYSTSEAEVLAGKGTPVAEVEPPLSGYSLEGDDVSVETGEVLQEHTTYFFRVIAKNASNEETKGNVQRFTTGPIEEPEKPEANPIGARTATFNDVLNPPYEGSPGTYEFLYKQSSEGCKVTEEEKEQGITQKRAPEPPAATAGGRQEHVHAAVTGLLPGTTYTFCLMVHNEAGERALSASVTFTTLALPPEITGVRVTGVSATAATVSAQINPDGASTPTSYHLEYGTSEAYGSSTPETSLGQPPPSPVGVTVALKELQPATKYYFRFVATGFGTTRGSATTFTTTQSLGPVGSTLADGRTYELVSPVGNADGDVYVSETGHEFLSEFQWTELPFQVAADGDAVAYVAEVGVSGGNGNLFADGGNEFLATRSSSGWSASDIEPLNQESGYQGFSSDLSLGILASAPEHQGEPGLAPGAPAGYGDLYARSFPGDGSYQPLSTVKPPQPEPDAAGVPRTSLHKGPAPAFAGGNSGTATTPEFTHLLFEVNEALTAPAEVDPPTTSHNDLYESVAGQVRLVNLLPPEHGAPERPAPDATFGAPPPLYPGYNGHIETAYGDGPDFSHVISADASRIFWTELNSEGQPAALYVRVDGTTSVQVDASVGGGGRFWTASADGSKAFFTKAGDLYQYDVDTAHTTDLAPNGNVQGVIGSSEDGSYVYFVADGVLAANENANRETAQKGHQEGQPNLYVWHNGATTFIATLNARDNNLTGGGLELQRQFGDWKPGPADRVAEVTPDGRHLVFTSVQQLTGYDNEYAYSELNRSGSRRSPEVFIYDAQSGDLFCASCNQSGAPPKQVFERPYFGKIQRWKSEIEEGASLPVSYLNSFIPRWISDDGDRVFFDTPQSLVPSDQNGIQDVYEWEQDGSGGCKRSGGCVYLISGGTSTTQSGLVGADATGDNVFFSTRDRLAPQDGNEEVDLYDARVGDGVPPAPPLCTGAGCQGVPPAPPVFATPSSVTFNGVGNFPPAPPGVAAKKAKAAKCRKGFVKKHNVCARVRKRTRARKAGNHGRASR